jgi:serine/threonine-protein kinase
MDDRIADLLEKWEEAADKGEELSAEELCRDCPECVEELRWRITALKRTSWTKKPLTAEPIHGSKPSDFGLPETLGRYFLETLLGTGGFGQVWKAFDPQLKRHIALKIPRRDKLAAPDHFLAEAQKVARLRHSGIVPVHDVGSQDGVFYIVSEFIEGGSLADQLAKGTPWRTETLAIIADVADALHHAHERGFVHRDIKPSNILLDEHGKPFLADFGIAVTNQEIQASSLGTLPYMAPEQLAEGKADTRSDIYSLGVVLYQLLTGRLPFDAADPVELRQKILTELLVNGNAAPGELLTICKKCLAKSPADRFASVSDLSAALRAAVGKPQRSPWQATQWAMSVLLALVIVGAGFAIWHFTGQPTENTKGEPITKINKPDDQPKNDVTPDAAGWVALVPLVQVSRDTQDAKWKVDGDSAEFGAGYKRAYVSIPISVHGDYELQTSITITKAREATTIYLPLIGDKAAVLEMRGDKGNVESPTATIRLLGLHPPPAAKATASMNVGTEYTLQCKVAVEADKAEIDISRDNQPLFQWSGRIDQITGTHVMRPTTLGLETAYYTSSRFGSLKLKVPSGRMTVLKNTLFEARKYEGHKDKVTCLVLSTDGKTFVTGSMDRTIRLWNLGGGESKVVDQPAEVTAVAMSSDGKTVACGCSTGVVRLFDVTGVKPKELHSFTQQTTPITALTFSPQGKFHFAGSKDGSFISWNLAADPPRAMPWPKIEGVPVTACFLPKKNIFAVGISSEPEKPGRFCYWQVNEDDGKVDPLLTPVIQGTSHITSLAFSPDSSWVLSACHPTGVAVWKLAPDWKEVKAAGVYQGQVGKVNGMAVSHDNLLASSAGADGTVRVWEIQRQGEYHRFEGHTGAVNAVVFTADRRYVLSAGDDGTVRLWRVGHTK